MSEKPLDWEDVRKEVFKWVSGSYANELEEFYDFTIREVKQRIQEAVQGLLEEIEKMKKYATNIQKEDLTEYIRGYWKGQENLIMEIEHLIKKYFPEMVKEKYKK